MSPSLDGARGYSRVLAGARGYSECLRGPRADVDIAVARLAVERLPEVGAAVLHTGHSRVLTGYSRGTHGILTGCSQGTHRVLTGYSWGAQRVLMGYSWVLRVLMGCSKGTHGCSKGTHVDLVEDVLQSALERVLEENVRKCAVLQLRHALRPPGAADAKRVQRMAKFSGATMQQMQPMRGMQRCDGGTFRRCNFARDEPATTRRPSCNMRRNPVATSGRLTRYSRGTRAVRRQCSRAHRGTRGYSRVLTLCSPGCSKVLTGTRGYSRVLAGGERSLLQPRRIDGRDRQRGGRRRSCRAG
jgi:hypothetical protein